MRKALILISSLLFLVTPCLAADLPRGKLLFNDSTLGNGTNGKTCNTCHEGGPDLATHIIHKENFEIIGVKVENTREAINLCIQVTLRGEGLDLRVRRWKISYLSWNLYPLGKRKKIDPLTVNNEGNQS